MAKDKEFFKRDFLNKDFHGSHAHVIGEADRNSLRLHISDCNNTVIIHNRLSTGRDKDNAIFKLTTLRDVCNQMLDFVENKQINFLAKKADRKVSFTSFTAAENFISEDEDYVKTTAPEGVECLGFYQYQKQNSYAMIIENPKMKRKRFQILYY